MHLGGGRGDAELVFSCFCLRRLQEVLNDISLATAAGVQYYVPNCFRQLDGDFYYSGTCWRSERDDSEMTGKGGQTYDDESDDC